MANIRLPQSSPAIGMPGVPRLPDPPASPDTGQYVGAALSGIGKILDAHAKDSEKRAATSDVLLLNSMGYDAAIKGMIENKINPVVQDEDGNVDLRATMKQADYIIQNYEDLVEQGGDEAREYSSGIDVMGKKTREKLESNIAGLVATALLDKEKSALSIRDIADEALVRITIQSIDEATVEALETGDLDGLKIAVGEAKGFSGTLNNRDHQERLNNSIDGVNTDIMNGIRASAVKQLNAITDIEGYKDWPVVSRYISDNEDKWLRSAESRVLSASTDDFQPPRLPDDFRIALERSPSGPWLARHMASRANGLRISLEARLLSTELLDGDAAAISENQRQLVLELPELDKAWASQHVYTDPNRFIMVLDNLSKIGSVPTRTGTPKALNALTLILEAANPSLENMKVISWAMDNKAHLSGLKEGLVKKLATASELRELGSDAGNFESIRDIWINYKGPIEDVKINGKNVPWADYERDALKEEGFKSSVFGDGPLQNQFEEYYEGFIDKKTDGRWEEYQWSGYPDSNEEFFKDAVINRYIATKEVWGDDHPVERLNDALNHVARNSFIKGAGKLELLRYNESDILGEDSDVIIANTLRDILKRDMFVDRSKGSFKDKDYDKIYREGTLVPAFPSAGPGVYLYERRDGYIVKDKNTGVNLLINMGEALNSKLDPKWLSSREEVNAATAFTHLLPKHDISSLLDQPFESLPLPGQVKLFEAAIANSRTDGLENGPWAPETIGGILDIPGWNELGVEAKSVAIGHILSNEKEKREQNPFITNEVTRPFFESAIKEIARSEEPKDIHDAARQGDWTETFAVPVPSMSWTPAMTQRAVVRGMELFDSAMVQGVNPRKLALLRDRIQGFAGKFNPAEIMNGQGTTSYIVNQALRSSKSIASTKGVPQSNLISDVLNSVASTIRERNDRPWLNEAMRRQESAYFEWAGGRKKDPKYYSVEGILSRRIEDIPVDTGPWGDLEILHSANGKLTKAIVKSWLNDSIEPTEPEGDTYGMNATNAFDLIRAEASSLFMEPDSRLIFAMKDAEFVRLLSGLVDEGKK